MGKGCISYSASKLKKLSIQLPIGFSFAALHKGDTNLLKPMDNVYLLYLNFRFAHYVVII